MLTVSNLICSRNEQRLFEKISFALQPGQMLQVTGKNGSGKSTLLKCLAGLIKQDAGQINLHPANVCYIGHQNNLHFSLTVQQNLNFLHALQFGTKHTAEKNVLAGLEYFSLQHKAGVKCSELSAGQLQRASLSRLCWMPKKIWLLDEPMANLDAAGVAAFVILCEQHLRAAGIIILATHALLSLDRQYATLCLSTE